MSNTWQKKIRFVLFLYPYRLCCELQYCLVPDGRRKHARNFTSYSTGYPGLEYRDYVPLLQRYGNEKALLEGKKLHNQIVRNGYGKDRFLANFLIEMYGKCGALKDACAVFHGIQEPNVFSWNFMISAYARCQNLQGARNVFDKMPNRDMVSWNEMLAAYFQYGSLEEARVLFTEMPRRDAVSWNIMLTAFAEIEEVDQVFTLFKEMQLEGIQPNRVTYLAMLDACAAVSALAEGKQMHCRILCRGLVPNVVIESALINMYGKCGCFNDARIAFEKMPQHNVISWNSILAAYAQIGRVNETLQLFQQMQYEGMFPDDLTFLSIIFACSHVGFVDKGCHYFLLASQGHNVTPTRSQNHCMIDLLGRYGKLDEAEDMIDSMSIEPVVTSWVTLLSACRVHGDLGRGRRVARRLFNMDTENATIYILLLNIYAISGRREDVEELRRMLKNEHLSKFSSFCI